MKSVDYNVLVEYQEMIKKYVDGRMTPADFESAYLKKFSTEKVEFSSAAFLVLDRLFSDVDSFCADPQVRGTHGLDEQQLMACAKRALAELSSLLRAGERGQVA